MQLVLTLAAFGFIALSARQIGQLFARFRLPLITGYIAGGIVAGPFVLEFFTSESIENLHFIEQASLAFIAFAAGSELFINELRSRLRSIAWVTAGLTVVTHLIGAVAVFLLADFIPFMRDLSISARVAASILIGAIMVARSPSSAIAIVNELRAKGMFTRTILGVTVVMDLVVIIIFAIDSALADALLTNTSPSLLLLLLLASDLVLALLAGLLVGKLLETILAGHFQQGIKAVLIVLVGYVVFLLADLLREFSHDYLAFEILLEPLLICVIASLYVTNRSRYRAEFSKILHDVGPMIYVAFFMLTGASLSLDIFLATWPIALVLFFVRLLGIVGGSRLGGIIAGDPMRYNRLLWLGFITQAGVALGLSREVAVEFPILGSAFATMIISVIVLNETIGPVLFKMAIRRIGEAHTTGQAEPDAVRDVLILGIGSQAQALAQQLLAHNWQVTMADTDAEQVKLVSDSRITAHLIGDISAEGLAGLVNPALDALVVMTGQDDLNLRACELAYEIGVPRLVARLNDYALALKFTDLGVHVVNPSSAMVHLLDQFVRSPQTAALVMEEEPGQRQVVQITITDPDYANIRLRELRLPDDILVLGILRDGTSILPHGHTILKLRDEVTLIGSPASLEQVTLRLGF